MAPLEYAARVISVRRLKELRWRQRSFQNFLSTFSEATVAELAPHSSTAPPWNWRCWCSCGRMGSFHEIVHAPHQACHRPCPTLQPAYSSACSLSCVVPKVIYHRCLPPHGGKTKDDSRAMLLYSFYSKASSGSRSSLRQQPPKFASLGTILSMKTRSSAVPQSPKKYRE